MSIFQRYAEVRRVEEVGAHKNKEPAFLAGNLLWFGGVSFDENEDEDYKAAAKRRGN